VSGREPRGDARPLVAAGLVESSMSPRAALLILGRALAVLGGVLLLYVVAPIDDDAARSFIAVAAALGLVGVLVVFFRQFGRITRAERPGPAALEALLLVAGLYLTLFAFIYVSLSASWPDSFSEPLDKVGGIYFSVTILATVGFGDIAPRTDLARVLVTGQMILNIVLIGSAAKLLTLSARRARSSRGRAGHLDPPISEHPASEE